MNDQANYNQHNPNFESHDQRFVKQRGDAWHSIRDKAKATGSTAITTLRLQTLKKQEQHFD